VDVAGLAARDVIGRRDVVGRLPGAGEFAEAEPAQIAGVRYQRQRAARGAEIGAVMHP
jgi:hypothetical protein